MRRRIKEYKRHLFRSLAFWTVSIVLFAIYRYFAIDHEIGIRIDAAYEPIYHFYQIVWSFGLSGFLLGIVYASVEYIFDTYLSRKIPLIINLLVQFVLISLSVIAISEVVSTFFSSVNRLDFDISPEIWYRNPSSWALFTYIFFASVIFSVLVISTDRLGRGKLIRMMVGHYLYPRETQRIFMFLDLKSSTAIAERLGHYKYSQLIQDFFYDINELVVPHDAEIYQYIGDEVVLTWPYKKGMKRNSSLRLFFALQKMITDKSDFYRKKYGLVPEFKAGLHGGALMVTQVGVVKKELAYHGDVINTTARIQEACNTYAAHLLISESLLEKLQKTRPITSRYIGNVMLKGKEKEVKIHTVEIN
ncbi:adenylate/guanylate cyclase domain-containing protein [Flagellimonas sp. HMM57]|uniref:adenylate/guanylate cyclase domain-containing protein n=1 Tax=unclassified Flagellimonas TaxID=2644544 RepID=UPI0013D70509|nr:MULTISPECIES: adenylate/guanylate cyclase domain-containing protein [unclassified Flagellimonas]UII74783.1 adenylate/guanylate cyclase domain-containing protein [Flagellimonas sp. HMM57]